MKNNLVILLGILILMVSYAFLNIKITGFSVIDFNRYEDSSVIFIEKQTDFIKIAIIPGIEGYSNVIQIKDLNTNSIEKINLDCEYKCQEIKKISLSTEDLIQGSYEISVFDFSREENIKSKFAI